MKKKFVLIHLIAALAIAPVFSTPYYDTGSQVFSIILGPVVPVSMTNLYTKDTGYFIGADGTHSSLAGLGALSYQVFTSPYLAIGGEIGYQFSFSLSNKLFTSVPFHAKATYFPIQGDFELPISLAAGLEYISYDNTSKLTVGATAEIGFTYYFSNFWGAGVKAGFQVIPEIYVTKPEMNGFATFLPICATITYRH